MQQEHDNQEILKSSQSENDNSNNTKTVKIEDNKKAKEYQRAHLKLNLIEEICTLLFLIIWVKISGYVIEQLPWQGYWLLIGFSAILYFSYQAALFFCDYLIGYKLEHKYQLSNETFSAWLWRHIKMIILSAVFLGLLVVLLYWALWNLKYWYFWCWLGWMIFTVIIAQIFPVIILPIFYKSKPLENPSLLERFRELAKGTGINIEGIYKLELSKSTKKANAMLAGLGATRRVLLGDTLLENLSTEEIEIVFAHELGHHVHKHFFKLLAINSIVSIILFAIFYLILGNYSGNDPETMKLAIQRLPLIALVMSIFSFVSRPALYALSRYFERQSDMFALKLTGNKEAFISAFEKLAEQNLADPDPSKLVVLMYYDHPPIRDRIAMAKSVNP